MPKEHASRAVFGQVTTEAPTARREAKPRYTREKPQSAPMSHRQEKQRLPVLVPNSPLRNTATLGRTHFLGSVAERRAPVQQSRPSCRLGVRTTSTSRR